MAEHHLVTSHGSGPSEASSSAPRIRATTERSRGWKRRIAKACDACRKRKIRCDGARPICSRCTTHGLECFYADFDKETPVRRSRGPAYVQQLEQRLRNAEGQLVDSNADNKEHQRGRSQDTASLNSARTGSIGSANTTGIEDLAIDHSSVLARGRTGDQRYFGPGSSLSILSSNGLRWIANHTRDPSVHRSLRTTLDEECRWTNWTHPILKDAIRRNSIYPLPSWTDALSLVEEYFQYFHKALPIFHPPTFMSMLNQQHSSEPIRNPGWWVSLNAVLAIAQRRRNEENPSPTEAEENLPWQFARNAMDLILDILMLNTSLTSVQALIALFCYFIGTPNPQPSFFLASAAVRTSHAIGLHETANLSNISGFEREQRQSVFWCALIADQAASFRTGRPPAHALYDTKIELPESIMGDTLEVTNAEGRTESIDLFRAAAWMARIQAEIYYRLYSPSTTNRSEAEITMAVLELDDRLTEWRTALPECVRPGYPMQAWCDPVNLDVARLQLDYFHSIITVHRMKAYRKDCVPKLQRDQSNPKLKADPLHFLFSERCVEGAKQSIEVLGIIPKRAASFFWGATHFPLSAFVVMFINKLPQPIRDPDELRAAEILINYVSRFSNDHIESHGHLFLAIMKELLRAARISVVKPGDTTSEGSVTSNAQTSPDGSLPTPANAPYTAPGGKTWEAGPSNLNHAGQIPQPLSSNALQHLEQQTMQNPNLANPIAGQALPGMHQAAMNYNGGGMSDQMFAGQEAWEALAQMPFPFPWNWQDLPFDMMQDIEPYRNG